MHLIYNSEQYSVVEFGCDNDRHALRFGAYEIMDKPAQREAFIDGELAANFREHVRDLIATESRSEEHTSELQSLMRISYAVFCLKKKKRQHKRQHTVTN